MLTKISKGIFWYLVSLNSTMTSKIATTCLQLACGPIPPVNYQISNVSRGIWSLGWRGSCDVPKLFRVTNASEGIPCGTHANDSRTGLYLPFTDCRSCPCTIHIYCLHWLFLGSLLGFDSGLIFLISLGLSLPFKASVYFRFLMSFMTFFIFATVTCSLGEKLWLRKRTAWSNLVNF